MQFNDPVIYTPGDNEWSDCHKTKQLSSGAPLAELAVVCKLFFANPGHSLGKTTKIVTSQGATATQFPTDSQFVENVVWAENNIVFAPYNIPGGSNDDSEVDTPWTAPYTDFAAQNKEHLERKAANLCWLDATFDLAVAQKSKAVVIKT
jgi:hypothetical protein